MELAYWNQFCTLLTQYWSVPTGMAIVYFFAKYHFNTPDYVLINDLPPDAVGSIDPKNSPAARLRTTAPPVFTTLRERYIKAEIKYIMGLEIAFMCITVFPNILTLIPNLQESAAFVSNSLEQRVVIAALVLTGFLSSFPFIRDFDGWLLKALHGQASIPDDAEQTADELFDVGYRRCPTIMRDIIIGMRSPHLRAVTNGAMSGALETSWLNIRCLTECLKDHLQEPRYRAFKRKFKFEFDDIYATVQRLRADVIKLLENQAAAVPVVDVTDIDAWVDENTASNPAVRDLSVQRAKLLFDIDAIRYRTCLFTSVLVYATEQNLQNLNETLVKLGFPVKITVPPTRTGDLVLFGIFGTFVICLMISFLYTLGVQTFAISIPESYRGDVPGAFKEAGFWSLTAAFIHGTACLGASTLTVHKIKAERARGLAIVAENPFTHTSLIALLSCIMPLLILVLFSALSNRSMSDILPWIVLPFITAFFSSYYIRMSAAGANIRGTLPEIQAGIMVICTLLLAITLNTQGALPQWPIIFWIFLVYASLTTGLIGFTLGEVFRRGLKAERQSALSVHTSASGLSFVSAE
jgi:hypothetical protein